MVSKVLWSLMAVSALALTAGQAQGSPYDRVAYWDSTYATSWAGVGDTVRDACVQAGYRVVNAAELKTWMDGHIADKNPSVVVFCRDDIPVTVGETETATCTLRRYLDAGGKVVWYSDIPLYYQALTGGTTVSIGTLVGDDTPNAGDYIGFIAFPGDLIGYRYWGIWITSTVALSAGKINAWIGPKSETPVSPTNMKK